MNILIVDDHPLTCHGLTGLLSAIHPTSRVHSANTVAQARAVMDGPTRLDWLFLDINLPDDPQREFVRHVWDSPWAGKTILISADTPVELLRAALGAGVRGFISKAADPDQIVTCFSAVRAGEVFVPEHLSRLLNGSPDGDIRSLSPRLRKVQVCLLRGASNKLIARELGLSEYTVKEYVSSLLAYHRVKNRLDLVLKLQGGS
ncbi:MAG: response regulator transcription factor [Rhodocyclaceae bacterium]|nr:response regulator transcription factor [Rhodocyclaceae bacterium]